MSTAIATDFKRQFAAQLARQLKKRKISNSELARRMSTSRAVVHRIFQGNDTGLTLKTMANAARVVGCHINVVLR
jgi:antitoxin HicB